MRISLLRCGNRYWTRWLQKIANVQGRITRRPGQRARYDGSALWVYPIEGMSLLPIGRQLGILGHDWDCATVGVDARLKGMRLGLGGSGSLCQVDTRSKGVRLVTCGRKPAYRVTTSRGVGVLWMGRDRR